MKVHRGTEVLPWLLRALGEPTRRDVYQAVQTADRPMTRLEVAEAVGITRRLAAFHLDKLAAEGLLDIHYARPLGGRRGPGAGRPAKRYRPSGVQFDVTIPPRRDDLAARIMVLAHKQLGRDGAHREALLDQARACGKALAATGPSDLLSQLRSLGYQPVSQPDGTISMPNCPFHRIAKIAPQTACSMNHALLDALNNDPPSRYHAVLDPAQGRCCVLLRPLS